MMRHFVLLATILWSGFALAQAAPAPENLPGVDPATLHIGTGGPTTACPTGPTTTAPCNTSDPFDMVSSTMVSVFQEQGRGSVLATKASPLTIAIIVPNTASLSGTLSLTGANFYNSGGTLIGNGSSVSSGTPFTYTGGTDIYQAMGAKEKGDGSINFANLTAAKADKGATSFTVYTFNVVGCSTCVIGPKGYASFSFNQNLPVGAVVVAYGYDSKGRQYSVAWTNAGFVNPAAVPEPSAVLLLGSGLAVLACTLMLRR
jgi:hypothetical protein